MENTQKGTKLLEVRNIIPHQPGCRVTVAPGDVFAFASNRLHMKVDDYTKGDRFVHRCHTLRDGLLISLADLAQWRVSEEGRKELRLREVLSKKERM